MRKRLLLSISLALLLLLILPGQISHATPTPPYILVNESTRECYVTILGDECSWCEPPQGWKILGTGDPTVQTYNCPAGYQKVDHLELNCTRYKTPFCCGVFSSHGNCEDMVVNAAQRTCAFVDDIHACILPEGWSKRPENIPEVSWNCNFTSSRWVANVTCLTATSTPAALTIGNAGILHSDAAPLIGIGLILLGGGMLVWLVRRRVKP